jgi:hypothetical protein
MHADPEFRSGMRERFGRDPWNVEIRKSGTS